MFPTDFFSNPTLENTMATFDLTNLETILTNHNDTNSKKYFYKHQTSGANIFKCECCDFETMMYITATNKRVNKKDQQFEYNSMVKNTHGIKTHMLSYEHRFNEYYGKGLIPVVPEFDGDLINNTFNFFSEHISPIPDDDGLVWCDLCDVSFKSRKQLYTHLVKNNKKHLVRQVEKEHNAPFKVTVMDKTYDIEYFSSKSTISEENRAKMAKYLTDDGYFCKHCNFTPVDEEDFYKHLTSNRHKKNKILDDNQQTYTIKADLSVFCNKCSCGVDNVIEHHKSH